MVRGSLMGVEQRGQSTEPGLERLSGEREESHRSGSVRGSWLKCWVYSTSDGCLAVART
ncbi:hypothetical protein [Pasteuria penetrans]|uniref:hypothetical protein n=1 Tax=Pasteuria penetrans TaxID=86005 RepID=UPI00165B1307|nr:hypothetical protein [Pasteuria penetrans]